MPNSKSSSDAEKPKKNKLQVPTDPIETVDLRLAARILTRKTQLKSLDYSVLLKLLIGGTIKAGFCVPGEPPIWIQIPNEYWARLHPSKFAKSKLGAESKIGVHRVQLRQFAEQFVEACFRVPAPTAETSIWAKDHFRRYVREAEERFTVVIDGQGWDRYLKEKDIDPNLPRDPKGSGRPVLDGWKEMSVVLAAYVMKELTENPERRLDSLSVATGARALAGRKFPGAQLPSAGTLLKHVTDSINLASDLKNEMSSS